MHAFPVTVDVTALYTSIPSEGQDGGMQAFEKELGKRQNKDVPTWYLMTLLKHILSQNIFEFDGEYWRQVIGTAMGTRVAPTYACLFMSYLENEKILKSWEGTQPLLYRRFIDDIFFIWPDTEAELTKFLEHMNNCHTRIKFKATYDQDLKVIPFLDLTVK